MDPKLKGAKEGILDRKYILKLNIKTPFSQSVHIQTVTKGRKGIFIPSSKLLTNKQNGQCPTSYERELSSQRYKRNGGAEGKGSGRRANHL